MDCRAARAGGHADAAGEYIAHTAFPPLKTHRYDAHHDFFNAKLYASDPGTIQLIQNGRRNRMITVLW